MRQRPITALAVRLATRRSARFGVWTAFVDVGSGVSFREDLYARDERVLRALREAPSFP